MTLKAIFWGHCDGIESSHSGVSGGPHAVQWGSWSLPPSGKQPYGPCCFSGEVGPWPAWSGQQWQVALLGHSRSLHSSLLPRQAEGPSVLEVMTALQPGASCGWKVWAMKSQTECRLPSPRLVKAQVKFSGILQVDLNSYCSLKIHHGGGYSYHRNAITNNFHPLPKSWALDFIKKLSCGSGEPLVKHLPAHHRLCCCWLQPPRDWGSFYAA